MHGVCSDPSGHSARRGLDPPIVPFLLCSNLAFPRDHRMSRPLLYLQDLGLTASVYAAALLGSLGSRPRFHRCLRAKLGSAGNQSWHMSPQEFPVILPLLP